MNNFQNYRRLLLIFIVIRLCDQVGCCQAVFARFGASRLKCVVDNFYNP